MMNRRVATYGEDSDANAEKGKENIYRAREFHSMQSTNEGVKTG
jgi:hypothetical protein